MRLESEIEQRVTDYAKSRSCVVLKLNVTGQVGWPDRMFLLPGKKTLFIEFKRPDEPVRKIQVYRGNKLAEYGFDYTVVDNVEQGCAAIDQFASGRPVLPRLHARGRLDG